MKAVPPPGMPFAGLRANLARLGWEEVRLPGLRPPLVPGEPEIARFERGAEVLCYGFNPAVRLRVVEGPLPDAVPRLGVADIAQLIGSADPADALCGLLAAAELGLTELRAEASEAAARLPPELSRAARRALQSLGRPTEGGTTPEPARPEPPRRGAKTAEVAPPMAPARPSLPAFRRTFGRNRTRPERLAPEDPRSRHRPPSGASAGTEGEAPEVRAYEALPIRVRRQVLRRAIRARDPLAPALVARSWRGDPELAATAAIGAARLGLVAQAGALEGRAPPAGLLPRREQELLVAVRRAALATLRGERPGPDNSARNRLWRAVLGDGGEDAITMAVAALVDPVPDPAPEVTLPNTSVAMRRVEAVPHWLGHDLVGGLPNPVRRWTPPAPFLISTTPLAASDVSALGLGFGEQLVLEATAPILAALAERTGRPIALPLADEWEAALRGSDGRPRPWGLDARPAAGAEASPWGVLPGRPGQGEWTRGLEAPIVCGADPSGRAASRAAPASGARHHLRIVVPAE